jgi:glycosyltransferase involved in cell wall biosynthesis
VLVNEKSRVVLKIAIVTSGQPSANPRVVKEATALCDSGFEVSVIYAPLSPWADEFDNELFKTYPSINWIRVGYHRYQQPVGYKYVTLRRKLNEVMQSKSSYPSTTPEKAFVLYSQELKKQAELLKADLYIGHNLGALPAVVNAAKKNNALCAFDAEDYHRGEDKEGSMHFRLAKAIEDKYIPMVTYLSAASPLISKAYSNLYPGKKVVTINNVFSKKYLQKSPSPAHQGLSLFWFSQTIGTNRGLEAVITAINKLASFDISLHLLGDCSAAYRQTLTQLMTNKSTLHFYSPVSLRDIFTISAKFDVGLAAEVPHCTNRQLCLTNKLFTYLLSGNYIFASNTKAQQQFINTYPEVGSTYIFDDVDDIACKLEALYNDKDKLFEGREAAHVLATTELNWEEESKKLVSIINSILTVEKSPDHIASLSTL